MNDDLTLNVAIYVDDFLIFYANESVFGKLKNFLKQALALKMKEIGEAMECIGIHISRTNDSIALSQKRYIEQLVERFEMHGCKAVKTPGDPNEKLSVAMVTESNDLTGRVPHKELIGSLLYVAQITRPDIAFCVNNVSRFNSKHTEEHWQSALRILKYLKYASDIDRRRSCTGFVVKYAGAAISWHSRRQELVALSSTEAEYIALSTSVKELLWIRQLINELTNKITYPIKVYCDNTSAITLAKSDAYRERTKHIDVRFHHIRENVERARIAISFVSTNDMLADVLTKALNGEKNKKFPKLFGVKE